MEDVLLENEKIIYDVKPQKKVAFMWVAMSLFILFLGPLGILVALLSSRSRDIRMLYVSSLILLMVFVILTLAITVMIPSSFGLLAFVPVLLFPPILYLAFFYVGVNMIYKKMRLILTDRRIIFKHGFITNFVHSVSYSKISDVKFTRGAYESLFGLRSIILETLSGQRSYGRGRAYQMGDIIVEGMNEKDIQEIESFVMKRMKDDPLNS